MTDNSPSPPSGSDVGKAIEWLRAQAKSAMEFANSMQDRRTAEYKARGDTDAHYAHITIEETREWHIATLIARLEAENKELRRASTDLLDKMELEAKAQSRLERMFENADVYSTPELEQAKDATCDAICAASEAITALKAALSPKSQTNGETT